MSPLISPGLFFPEFISHCSVVTLFVDFVSLLFELVWTFSLSLCVSLLAFGKVLLSARVAKIPKLMVRKSRLSRGVLEWIQKVFLFTINIRVGACYCWLFVCCCSSGVFSGFYYFFSLSVTLVKFSHHMLRKEKKKYRTQRKTPKNINKQTINNSTLRREYWL